MWIESIIDPVNEPRTAIQDLLNENALFLLLDSDVPNPPGDEESDDDPYDLPKITSPLTPDCTGLLEKTINPLDEDGNYGIDIYLKVIFTVLELLNAEKQ